MHRIALINQKGGVGKTTTAANLGAALARRGADTLLVDMDPQANLSMHYGLEAGPDQPSIYQVLSQQATMEHVVLPANDHLTLAPANIDLAAAEVELASIVGREIILREAVEKYANNNQFMLIDCPPSLGILTLNALCAADEVFITLQPHFLALQGFGKLLETVNLVARRINHRLKVRAIVLCMYESGTRLANEVVNDLTKFMDATRTQDVPWANAVIFKTQIRRNIKLAEAPSFGTDIFRYAPESHGANDYAALADEVLALYGLAGSTPSAAPASAPTTSATPTSPTAVAAPTAMPATPAAAPSAPVIPSAVPPAMPTTDAAQ